MILVTKPFLPPKEEYFSILKEVLDREYLTNNGPVLRQFEEHLRGFHQTENLFVVSDGTTALQIAIKALDLSGEVITTPFSYIATSSSLVWLNCTPVFSDIDAGSFNLDPTLIEEKITSQTSAILATHVFGNPCNIEVIEKLAAKHGLKVIYDAAHCFGVRYKQKSILSYGDVSTLSLHATKIMHAVEGGIVVVNQNDLRDKVRLMRNFGHDGPSVFSDVGINGKMSELHAAIGTVNLRYAERILTKYKLNHSLYDGSLATGKFLKQTIDQDQVEHNFSYYPIVLESEEVVLKLVEELNKHDIYPRRYFYPALNKIGYLEGSCQTEVAEDISSRILCLPNYYALEEADILSVSEIVNSFI